MGFEKICFTAAETDAADDGFSGAATFGPLSIT